MTTVDALELARALIRRPSVTPAMGSSSPISNYSSSPGATWTYGPNEFELAFGQTITMDVYANDYYAAETIAGFPPVPLPSTLLLLGFGLVALAGLGRRYRYKKS